MLGLQGVSLGWVLALLDGAGYAAFDELPGGFLHGGEVAGLGQYFECFICGHVAAHLVGVLDHDSYQVVWYYWDCPPCIWAIIRVSVVQGVLL